MSDKSVLHGRLLTDKTCEYDIGTLEYGAILCADPAIVKVWRDNSEQPCKFLCQAHYDIVWHDYLKGNYETVGREKLQEIGS